MEGTTDESVHAWRPGLLSERYELAEVIGCGGTAVVWRGKDLRLDRTVAIKILRTGHAHERSLVERFRHEAQNSAALNHPGIVSVYDTGETADADGRLPFLVMEFVQGCTLRELLVQQGPLTPEAAARITAAVCAALDFSHRHGIVHCDVKPGNVMIDRAGTVKLMDFGIARDVDAARATTTLTGTIMGTAHYLSPEQIRGQQADHRSDVYAAGCLLYELLTGAPPFAGDSPVSLCHQHLSEDPRPPSLRNPAVGAGLDAVTLTALTKGPANRYQTAAEMRSDLLRVLRHRRPLAPKILTSGTAYDDQNAGRKRAPMRRRRNAVPSLLVIAALAGLAVLWQLDARGGEPVHPIPSVAGQPYLTAENTLHEAGFHRIERHTVRCWAQSYGTKPPCGQHEFGRALATHPRAGTKASTDTAITLDIGKPPQTFRMPGLKGMPQAVAKKLLARRQLHVAPVVRHVTSSDRGRVGTVAAQRPAAGERVAQGDTVSLAVYATPAMVPVIGYVGEREEVARAGLEAAGFEVVSEHVPSDRAPGIVVAQEPDSGQATAGSSVVIHVSDGSLRIMRMPDIIGMTENDARSALASDGHLGRVRVQHVAVDEQNRQFKDLVVRSEPRPGARMRRAGDIVLVVGRYDGAASTSENPPTTTATTPPATTGPRRRSVAAFRRTSG